jgi:hypothetical protein
MMPQRSSGLDRLAQGVAGASPKEGFARLDADVVDSEMANSENPEWAQSSIQGEWGVPSIVELDEDSGMLTWRSTPGSTRRVKPPRDLLKSFLELQDSEDAKIVAFAKKWGPLHLCAAHPGRPTSHLGAQKLTWDLDDPPSFCREVHLPDGRPAESIEAWRELSRQAEFIVRAGMSARKGSSRYETSDELLAEFAGLPRDTPLMTTLASIYMQLKDQQPEREDITALLRTADQHVAEGIAQAHLRQPGPWEAFVIKLGLGSGFREARRKRIESAPEMIDVRARFKETMIRSLDRPDALADHVQRWIEDGGGYEVRPAWVGGNGGTAIWRAEVTSLYAAIGVALWNAIRGGIGIGFCPYCNALFELKRRDKPHCGQPACDTAHGRVRKQKSRDK